MVKPARKQLLHYGLVPIVVGLAVYLRLLLASWLDAEAYFLFLWPAVVLCAWYGGLGPGLFATLLSALAANYYFLRPTHSLAIVNRTELIVMAIFVLFGFLISFLSERLHWTTQRLEVSCAESNRQATWLRVILASIDNAVLATDQAGRVSFLNASAQRLTGWQEADAVGRPHAEVLRTLSEALWRPVESPIARALLAQSRVPFSSHMVVLGKDGAATPIEGQADCLRDGNETPIGVVLIFRDTTERRRGEEARSQLAAIVESSDDAIVSRTLHGIVTTWNRGAECLYGYPAEEMIGRPISLLVPNDRADELPEVTERLRQGERIAPFETVRLRKDGSLIDVSVSIAPLKNEAGKVIGSAVIARQLPDRPRHGMSTKHFLVG